MNRHQQRPDGRETEQDADGGALARASQGTRRARSNGAVRHHSRGENRHVEEKFDDRNLPEQIHLAPRQSPAVTMNSTRRSTSGPVVWRWCDSAKFWPESASVSFSLSR